MTCTGRCRVGGVNGDMTTISTKILASDDLTQGTLLQVSQRPTPRAVMQPHWFCRTCGRATEPLSVGREQVCGFENCRSTKMVFNG